MPCRPFWLLVLLGALAIPAGAEYARPDALVSYPHSPGDDYRPQVVFDSALDSYAVFWFEDWPAAPPNLAHRFVAVRFLSHLGEPGNGGFLYLSQDEVADRAQVTAGYDPVNDRFLLVYTKENGGSWDIFARWFKPGTSQVLWPEFQLSSSAGTNEWNPRVAYSSFSQVFLVVWTQEDPSPGGFTEVHGALVHSGWDQVEPDFPIASPQDAFRANPDVAYDIWANSFFVVYDSSFGTYNVFGRTVSTGKALGPEQVIANQPDEESHPAIAGGGWYRYLVVWERDSGAQSDIFGRLLNTDGTPIGLAFPIVTTTLHESKPAVAAVARGLFSGLPLRWLVSWEQQYFSVSGDYGISGMVVDVGGVMKPPFTIRPQTMLDPPGRTMGLPAVAGSPNDWMIAWEHHEPGALSTVHASAILDLCVANFECGSLCEWADWRP